MTKLKTLEDIEKCGIVPCYRVPQIHEKSVTSRELKALMVMWAKNERAYHNEFRDARADVLIEIFNLTEEDFEYG